GGGCGSVLGPPWGGNQSHTGDLCDPVVKWLAHGDQPPIHDTCFGERTDRMVALDWSQCPAVESIPGRLGGAWVFRGTRMPVSAVFENLEAGASIDDIIEQFDITREQINAVLDFAARSLGAPVPAG